MADPTTPTPGTPLQALKQEMAETIKTLGQLLSTLKPFDWDSLVKQLEAAEALVTDATGKAEIREGREWVRRVAAAGEAEMRQQGLASEGELREKLKELETWPVHEEKRIIPPVRPSPVMPPTPAKAEQLIRKCLELLDKLKPIDEEQEDHLENIKGVEAALRKREAEIMAVLEDMQKTYKMHRMGLLADMKAKGVDDPGKYLKLKDIYNRHCVALLPLAAKLAENGKVMETETAGLRSYDALLGTSQKYVSHLTELLGAVKALDQVVTGFPDVRADVFSKIDKAVRARLQGAGIQGHEDFIRYLENTITANQELAGQLGATRIKAFRDYVRSIRTTAELLQKFFADTRCAYRFDYAMEDLAAALQYPSRNLILDIRKYAEESTRILQAVKTVAEHMSSGIKSDAAAVDFIRSSLVEIQHDLDLRV